MTNPMTPEQMLQALDNTRPSSPAHARQIAELRGRIVQFIQQVGSVDALAAEYERLLVAGEIASTEIR